MIHEYNPINMLYHYFIQLHPNKFYYKTNLHIDKYEFLSYNRLNLYFYTNDIKSIFKIFNERHIITLMEPNVGEGGGGEIKKKGGRKKRKSKKRVNKKRKRTRKN